MKIFFSLLVLLSLTSCATKRMLVKDVPQDEVQRDDYSCRAQSMSANKPDFAYQGTFMEGASAQKNQQQAWEYCMIGKGYSYAPGK